MLSQHSVDERDGQSDNIEIAARDGGDPPGCESLDGVRACLVHWFSGGDVQANLFVGDGAEGDLRGFGAKVGEAVGSNEAHASGDLMGSSGEKAEHTGGVIGVGRLFEGVLIDDDNGVSAEDETAGVMGGNGLCFFLRESSGVLEWWFLGQGHFGNVRGVDGKINAGVA